MILDGFGQIEETFQFGTSTRDKPAVIAYAVAGAYAVAAYSLVGFVHTLPTIPMVALGLETPESFPAYMGPVQRSDSLRGLWGWTWHQSGRRTIISIASWLAEMTSGSQRRAFDTVYLRTCIGFALGAFTHAVAGWMASSRESWWDPTGSIEFFAWQLCGVFLEDIVHDRLLAYKLLDRDPRREAEGSEKVKVAKERPKVMSPSEGSIIGYLWIFFWLSLTLPPYVEGLGKVGVIGPRIVPFSIIGWIIRRFGG